MVIPRSRSSGALSIESNGRNCTLGLRLASTLVIAAVSVVFPWSMCPMVPILTCGLTRSNFSFAIARHPQLADALYHLSYPGPHPYPYIYSIPLSGCGLRRYQRQSPAALFGTRFARLPSGLTCCARRWWTGEDSNLRSPQGAADLQS